MLPMSQPVRCDCSGGAAPASSAPAVGSELASEYGSDDEVGQGSIQASAATAAEARDSGSQNANGLPSNFFEVCLPIRIAPASQPLDANKPSGAFAPSSHCGFGRLF